jgi:hemolysin-activating ACP:hemolysin acyltransferase
MHESVENQKGINQDKRQRDAIRRHRFSDSFVAYAQAVNFLRPVDPYASYRFGGFAGTLAGQIERGHCLFAVRGNQVVGYVGWAMCTEEVARAWVEGRHTPSYEECNSGDCVVVMTWHAVSKGVVSFLARELRKVYPNRKAIFSRQYANGRPGRLGEVYNRVNHY